MSEHQKLAVAAHLHVLMRRKLRHVIDALRVSRDAAYAKEVITVAYASGDRELMAWANKLEALFPPEQSGEPQQYDSFFDGVGPNRVRR